MTNAESDADADPVAPMTIGPDVPLPNLTDPPAAWADATHSAVLHAIRDAPHGYEVRAYIETATGERREVVTVPPEAHVGMTPHAIGTAADGTHTPRERAALYVVVATADAFCSHDDVNAIEDGVRAAHHEWLADVNAAADGNPNPFAEPDPDADDSALSRARAQPHVAYDADRHR